MEKITTNSNIQSETVVVTSRAVYGYGRADVVGARLAEPASLSSQDVLLNLRFFIGEVTGILFVLLTTLYIFAMPASLTRAGAVRAMVRRIVKRTIDIAGSLTGIILSMPVWLVVPVLIKLDSPGPIFYGQTRVGVNRRRHSRRVIQRSGVADSRSTERRCEDLMGRPFRVLKFRTMVADAERGSGPVWATKNDPRITRLGSFLRKTRIDEIPQFVNILRGEMSLVGPRPERPHFVRDLSTKVDGYENRLKVKPGLTGLAQIENGYDSSLSSVTEKVRFDLQYIRNWSVWYDLKIMAKTVVVVITGKGAC